MSVIDADRAYFLHQTPYRDNSALVQLLTQTNGRVSFIVRGIQSKKSTKRAFLQPCRRLRVGYRLKDGLSQLTDIDFDALGREAHQGQSTPQATQTTPSIADFMLYQYANELLLTILPERLPVPTLFDDYEIFLQELLEKRPHSALRHIEMALIAAFSGFPDLSQTQDSKQPVREQLDYFFYAEQGLFTVPQHAVGDDAKNSAIDLPGVQISGSQILAFQHLSNAYLNANRTGNETLAQGAKPLSTALIRQLLNGKPLKTRNMFQALQPYLHV